mgnify:CR=1 FL=1
MDSAYTFLNRECMIEHVEQLIRDYGYLLIFAWTFLEGETVLIVAGAMAARGMLNIHEAVFSALIGSMLGDNCYFLLGKYKGQWLIERRPQWKPGIEKVLRLLERNSLWLILSFRFMYGVRNVTSLAVGMSHVGIRTFIILNAIGATIWAMSFGWGGYYLGHILLGYVEKAQHFQLYIIAAVVLAVVLALKIRARRAKRQKAEAGVEENQ